MEGKGKEPVRFLLSLKGKQKEDLQSVLRFNKPANEIIEEENNWKVFIYDRHCSDIVSLLLRKGELKELGITLNLFIEQERDAITDAPAIYFVMPTSDNIKRIGYDGKNSMYSNFHLNFCHSFPQAKMMELADTCIRNNCVEMVKSVCEQFLDFLSLEDDLFILNHSDSYKTFNDKNISPLEAETAIEMTANALFSVVKTLEVMPIIRCPPNSAAEMVSKRLHKLLQDDILSSNAFSEYNGIKRLQRPVLLILDRTIDLTVMLQHPSTYQSMVHDLLGSRMNEVKIVNDDREGGQSSTYTKLYDLDISYDKFWAKHINSPLHEIATDIHNELEEYKKTVDEFKKLGISDETTGEELRNQLLTKTGGLKTFASTLPELRDRKKEIDKHMDIACSLMRIVGERSLSNYGPLEDNLLANTLKCHSDALAFLKGDKGSETDKLRLAIIYFLTKGSMSSSEFEELTSLVNSQYLFVFNYLRENKSLLQRQPGSPSSTNRTASSDVASSSTSSIFAKFGKDAVSLLRDGMNAFKPTTTKDYPVTRIVRDVMDHKEETFCYFDPKSSTPSVIPKKIYPFKEAIVFVIGGGNYSEYQNLKVMMKEEATPRNVIYGSTELLTAEQLLVQINSMCKLSE